MRSILALSMVMLAGASAALPEPDVVFYGRVIHLGGGEEYLVTSGELEWQIDPLTPSQYTRFETKTSLASLNGGTMSYAIRIPNHLVIEDTVTGVLPGLALPEHQEIPFKNTRVTINGLPVRLADPDGFRFSVSSLERGATRRLDLIYDGALPDADRDGLPDWWEEKYGTNGQLADSSGDLDGDGVSNLDEYLAGTNPSEEDVRPRIASEVLVSMPVSGGAVPILRAIDGDSDPHDLVYVADGLPSGVSIEILGREQLWTLSFTQADVDAGRVILRHSGTDTGDFLINLTLRDEDPTHPAAQTRLRLSVGEDASLWEGWQLASEARPDALPIIQDASRLSGGFTLKAPSSDEAFEPTGDEPRLYLGSPQVDHLLGSAHGDLIVPGDGDTVRGGLGSDRILLGQAAGLVVIEDFSIEEEDVLDLRDLLEPEASLPLHAYVQRVGQDLMINVDGDGSGYDDLTIRLAGEGDAPDPAELWDLGLLEVGELVPVTTLFLSVSGSAEEEDLRAATIQVRRLGDVSMPLRLPLVWSGTAVLGRDYASVPSVATFREGEKTVSFVIQPLADDERETNETVQVELGASDAWVIADGHRTASLQIVDLPSRVWLEVAERIAYRSGASPAQLLVRRSGPMSAPLSVSLSVKGTAAANVDYERLPASVTFGPAQDVVVIPNQFHVGFICVGAAKPKIDLGHIGGRSVQNHLGKRD